MITITDDLVAPLLLAYLPAPFVQRWSRTCRLCLQQSMSPALEQVWAQLVYADYGGAAAHSAAMWSAGQGNARIAHRTLARFRACFQKAIVVLHDDLCDVPKHRAVDAVICPSVPNCGPYGYCARAVHTSAGRELMEYLQSETLPSIGGSLQVGEAVAVPAFSFVGVQAIVHAVGPTVWDAIPERKQKLHSAYKAAIVALTTWHEGPLRRAVVASISTGGNGMSPSEAAPIAMAAFRDGFFRGDFDCIYMTCSDQLTVDAFESAKRDTCARINQLPDLGAASNF